MDRRLLTRVKLRNYKSIAACDVAPAQLSFLVGPNGSGKSNFLDALRFIADSLRFSIDHALRDRGGRSGPRNLDSGLSEISIVFQAAVPKLVASKYTTLGVRRPSEL